MRARKASRKEPFENGRASKESSLAVLDHFSPSYVCSKTRSGGRYPGSGASWLLITQYAVSQAGRCTIVDYVSGVCRERTMLMLVIGNSGQKSQTQIYCQSYFTDFHVKTSDSKE